VTPQQLRSIGVFARSSNPCRISHEAATISQLCVASGLNSGGVKEGRLGELSVSTISFAIFWISFCVCSVMLFGALLL